MARLESNVGGAAESGVFAGSDSGGIAGCGGGVFLFGTRRSC